MSASDNTIVALSLLLCLLAAAAFVSPPLKATQTRRPFFATACSSHPSDNTRLHFSASWQSHVSTEVDASSALSELLQEIEQNSDSPPQLAFLFVGQTHASQFESLVQKAFCHLKPCRLLSVVGGGVVGDHQELDEPSMPSMALMAGRLPAGAQVELFSFNELLQPPPAPLSDYWNKLAAGDQKEKTQNNKASYILFADPWSPMEAIIEGLTSSHADAVVVGGISVPTTTQPTVAVDDRAMPQGSAVGVAFKGTLGLQAVVAQGCRPVGLVYTVTALERNCIVELDGQPALEVLESFVRQASTIDEQRQLGSGLVCGIASGDAQLENDYLIRQIVGFVPAKKGIQVAGSDVQVGDHFCFHVRDKTTAAEDLQLMVKRAQTERLFSTDNVGTPVAALQVSCVARGRGLFGAPNVDLNTLSELLITNDDAAAVVGGFYANGEIGPVGVAGFSTTDGGGTHLHGFTTVVALFCDYSSESNDDSSEFPEDGRATNASTDEPVDAWG